jgi:hypothetical protein
LEELQQAKELGEVTITYALDRWLTTVKTDSDSGNEHTQSKYQTATKQIGAWVRRNQLVRLSQITPDVLDQWKSHWSPKAKQRDDRIGKTTAGTYVVGRSAFEEACSQRRKKRQTDYNPVTSRAQMFLHTRSR